MHNNGAGLNQLSPKQLLTERELSIVQLTCYENSNKQIAAILNISIRTVEKHKETIRRKLGVLTKTGVIIYATRNNLF
jgi:two-component system, NarL family, nitrate/nitrite response regulator NarL